jgi:tetratricopeptide (TPR) repeat protein
MSRPRRTGAIPLLLLAVLAVLAGPSALAGQVLTPRGMVAGGCPDWTLLDGRPSAEDARRASSLARDAQAAALAGDPARARDLLSETALLDPTDPAVAYLLARAHEDAGDPEGAAREFCRYLALAPGGADADEARGRIEELTGPARLGLSPAVVEQFAISTEHLRAGDYRSAAFALDYVTREAPRFAEAYFNRALLSIERGDYRAAAADLDHYLALAPEAADRADVATASARLRAAATPPGRAFAAGAIVPGLGQFVTGRPVLGGLALAVAGGAAAFAARPRTETRTERFTDPFGNSYEERSTVEVRSVSRVVVSVAAVSLAAAVEAYLHAARARQNLPVVDLAAGARIDPIVWSDGSGWGIGLRIPR